MPPIVRQQCSSLLCRLAALVTVVTCLGATLYAQAFSPQRQVLLKRKAELLKSIEAYEKKQTDAQATLDQAVSIRKRAEAAGDSKNAAIAAQATDVAKAAIANAQKYEREDRERLDAINTALSWPEAQTAQGIPTLVSGHVFRVTGFGQIPFDPKNPVRVGDRISTGDDGYLELQLEDGSQIQIGPKTDFVYERDVQGMYYQLFRGALHKMTIIIGVLGANDQPRYRGLQAIAAVRGTEFTLEVNNGQDVFTVFEGEIELNPGAGRPKVSLRAEQTLAVPWAGPVGEPVGFDPKAVSHWWQR